MSVDARLQMALAHDAQFLDRVQYAMAVVALEVVAEATTVVGHAARRLYAQTVLGNPATAAASFAVALVGQVNLTSATTVVDFDGRVTSSATDAAIASQVSTLWNAAAGV